MCLEMVSSLVVIAQNLFILLIYITVDLFHWDMCAIEENCAFNAKNSARLSLFLVWDCKLMASCGQLKKYKRKSKKYSSRLLRKLRMSICAFNGFSTHAGHLPLTNSGPMNSAKNILPSPIQLIHQASAHHFSGSITFHHASVPPLRLVCKLGRIIWATGGMHRFRRWQRLSKAFLPSLTDEVSKLYSPMPSPLWEYQLLMLLLQQNCISRDCASNLLYACLQEVLFEITQLYPDIQHVELERSSEYKAVESLIFPSLEKVIAPVHQSWQGWRGAGLATVSPNAAPLLVNPVAIREQTSPKTYQNLVALLRGQASLRELAQVLQQNLLTLSHRLHDYEQQDLLAFQEVPDCSPPWGQAESLPSMLDNSDAPLVYCIDDVAHICESLGRIVEDQGYRFASTQDSVSALHEIIEKKPDLIFVDLVMPIMSGYEVCTQIRRIAAFQETPVIILTGNDGVIDRVRSKLVGATEFTSKPVLSEQIIPLLKKYLPLSASRELATSHS